MHSAADVVARTGATELVELGAGHATKTRVLLDAMRDAGALRRYTAFDVSETTVLACGDQLTREYPDLSFHGVVGDFERHLDTIAPADGPRIVAFLGGTIGNFLPGSRRRFLRGLSALLGPDGYLLLGTDLVKHPAVLEAAYNDSAGVTGEFNRNVLRVVNARLDADFDLDLFEHVAFYDRAHEWIEMRLRARGPCTVTVSALDLRVSFAAGEELRTEISAKFTAERLRDDLAAAGLELETTYRDGEQRFGVSLSRPAR
jgi:L-histidine N-alpha-methyltransferase